jgi:hypothetical protein
MSPLERLENEDREILCDVAIGNPLQFNTKGPASAKYVDRTRGILEK